MPLHSRIYTEQVINVCCMQEMYYFYHHLNTGVLIFLKFTALTQHTKSIVRRPKSEVVEKLPSPLSNVPRSAHLAGGGSSHPWTLGCFPATLLTARFIPTLRHRGFHFNSYAFLCLVVQWTLQTSFLPLLNRFLPIRYILWSHI